MFYLNQHIAHKIDISTIQKCSVLPNTSPNQLMLLLVITALYMQHRRWNSNNDRILFQICDWIPIKSNCKVDTFILAFLHLVQIFRAPFLLFLLLILIILAPLPGLIYYFYCCICLQPWYWFIQWLPRFFILPFRLCFIFGLPAYLFGSIIPKKLAMGFMRTAASTFFYTWDVFLGCLLIPPTSDLPIVEVVIVASLCLVPMKTPFKMKASLQNEGAKSFQAK